MPCGCAVLPHDQNVWPLIRYLCVMNLYVNEWNRYRGCKVALLWCHWHTYLRSVLPCSSFNTKITISVMVTLVSLTLRCVSYFCVNCKALFAWKEVVQRASVWCLNQKSYNHTTRMSFATFWQGRQSYMPCSDYSYKCNSNNVHLQMGL